MKPLHASLLMVGATLAGGLAFEMTQPQPFAVAPAPIAVNQTPVNQAPTPAPLVPPAPLSATPVNAAPIKPSPMPDRVAPAPAAVYEETVRASIQKTPIRKDEPILTAKATAPVPYEPPAAQARVEPQPPPQPEPKFTARQVTLPAGMTVQIRLNQTISSDRAAPGDTFDASLAEPLIVDGLVIAERGARAGGRIVDAQKAGRIGGSSLMELELTQVLTADGQKIAISTDPWTRRGVTSPTSDAAKIGGGAALGAMIGALAGGGTGAAIGAGVGGSAGAGAVLATRGKPVNLPSETIIRFRLATRVTIRERQL